MLLLVPNEPSATFTRVFLLEISNQDVKESQAWDKESSSLGQEEFGLGTRRVSIDAVADPPLLSLSQGDTPGLSQRQENQSYPSAGQQIPSLKYRRCVLEWSFGLTP